jgi:hypothetical protein
MSETRLYTVENTKTKEVRLVEAKNQSAAVNHCIRNDYEVKSANAIRVAKLMSSGVKLESAVEVEANHV